VAQLEYDKGRFLCYFIIIIVLLTVVLIANSGFFLFGSLFSPALNLDNKEKP